MVNFVQKKPKVDRSAMRMVFTIFWEHMRNYPVAAITILITATSIRLIDISLPWVFKLFLDTVTSASATPETISGRLFYLFQIIAIFSVVRWVLYRIQPVAIMYFQVNIMKDLSMRAFENLLGHSYRFFSNNFTGSIVRKVNRLGQAFEDVMDQIEGNLFPILISSIGILVVLYQRHWLLGAILALWLFIFLITYYFIAIWKVKYDRARAEKDSEATGVLSDAMTNIMTIKLFPNYNHEKTLYQNVLDELKRLRYISWGIGEGVDALQGAFMIALELALYYIWISLWQKGLATIGDFILIQIYLVVLLQRLWEFGRVIRRIYERVADAYEMVEIIRTPFDVQDHPHAKKLAVTAGKIEFKNITFGFIDGDRTVLRNFCLEVQPNEKVALVGPSGAGKSTVITLLLRLHDIQEGVILIDGQNISHVDQESLRKNIALVPQDSILFHRTLMENIRYGRLDASDEEVFDAAQKANCHEFISRLPYGYETYVGERGIKLSGGERQRVAIARAILANTKILVLDEATSSLDSEIESLIQDALKNLMKEKTAIVIAHRLSTIAQMDRIVVVDEGKITETGTHEDLIAGGGIYQRLWSLQAEGFLESQAGE